MEPKKWMTLDELYDKFGQAASIKEVFYDWMGANKWLFVQINSIRADWYDALMVAISRLGEPHAFPYYLMGLLAMVLASTLIRKLRRKGGTQNYLAGWVGVLCVITSGFAINTMVVKTAKNYFHFPRPYIALAQDQIYHEQHVTVLDRKNDPEDDYRSFPSGHVAFITLMVAALWPMLSHRIQWMGVLSIAAMSWSRMAVGMHFPADAIASITMTTLLVVILRAMVYKLLRRMFKLNC